MSSYFNSLLGYVRQFFRKDNSIKNRYLIKPKPHNKYGKYFSSTIFKEELDLIIEKKHLSTADNQEEDALKIDHPIENTYCKASQTPHLKRYYSCPRINSEDLAYGNNKFQCTTCSEIFNLLGTTEELNRELHFNQNESKGFNSDHKENLSSKEIYQVEENAIQSNLKRCNSTPSLHSENESDKSRCAICAEKLNNFCATEDQHKLKSVLDDQQFIENSTLGPSRNSLNSEINLKLVSSKKLLSPLTVKAPTNSQKDTAVFYEMGGGDGTLFTREDSKNNLHFTQERNCLMNEQEKEIDFVNKNSTKPSFSIKKVDAKLFIHEDSKDNLDFNQERNCHMNEQEKEIDLINTNSAKPSFSIKRGDGALFTSEDSKDSLHFNQERNCHINEQEKEIDFINKSSTKPSCSIKRDNTTSLRSTAETIPEYLYFQPLISCDTVNAYVKDHQVLTTEQVQSQIIKSKIPIHESQKKLKFCSNVPHTTPNKLKNSTRMHFYDWATMSWFRSKSKTNNIRNSSINIAIAERSLLNSKFDKMFRQFSNKIYRGNIIDHSSHSRWMKMAGRVEEMNASGFKKFAKSKVVLTLIEYKEALLKMCDDYHWNYWDLIKKMTEVEIEE